MDKKVYIIILNYNSWQDTIECLESVLKNSYENYQIIVVDNNSPNNSMDYLLKWAEGKICLWLPDSNPLKSLSFPLEKKPLEYILYTKAEAIQGGVKEKESKFKNPIIFIQAGENRGFAAGNNIGIKYALAKNDFEYICLLNNDTVVNKDFLSKIIKKFEKNANIGICSGNINYYDEPNKIWFKGGQFNTITSQTKHFDYGKYENYLCSNNESKKINFLTGCLWVVKKEVFEKVGLLNEDYFMYVEDLEYSLKVHKRGYKLDIECKSQIYHKVGASSGNEISAFSSYWMMRNRILFIRKNLTPLYQMTSIFFILFTRLIRFPQWVINNRWDIIRAQISGLFRGLLDK